MKRFLLGSALLALVVISIFRFMEVRYFRNLIPAELATEGTFFVSTNTDFFFGGCGAAAYWLTPETLKRIQYEGLNFLDTASFGWKNQLGGKPKHKVFYKWRLLTDPQSLLSNGIPVELFCAGEPRKGWFKEFRAAVRKGPVYVGTRAGGSLILIPSMKIVMFIYFD